MAIDNRLMIDMTGYGGKGESGIATNRPDFIVAANIAGHFFGVGKAAKAIAIRVIDRVAVGIGIGTRFRMVGMEGVNARGGRGGVLEVRVCGGGFLGRCVVIVGRCITMGRGSGIRWNGSVGEKLQI